MRSVLDLFYGYLKKGCCDGMCEARLKALTTLHLRGMHFKVRFPGGAGGPLKGKEARHFGEQPVWETARGRPASAPLGFES